MPAKLPLEKSVATKLIQRPGWTAVKFHDTEVIGWDEETIRLDSGDWRTVTTMRRINQAAARFKLGFHLYQEKYEWFIKFFDADYNPIGEPIPFFDGITLSRDRTQPHPLETKLDNEREYNGWPNRSTWSCMLWLNNDYGFYSAYTAQAKREAFTPMSARNFVMRLFGYRSMFYARTPDGEILNRVHWPRIADAMNEGNTEAKAA